MVLIKTVIMTVLAFWIYTFTQPKGVLKRIRMLMARFLSGVKRDEKVSRKFGWRRCCPPYEGRLGERRLTCLCKTAVLHHKWDYQGGRPLIWNS